MFRLTGEALASFAREIKRGHLLVCGPLLALFKLGGVPFFKSESY